MGSFIGDIVTSLSASSVTIFVVAAAVVYAVNLLCNAVTGRRMNVPPGPYKLPFVGSLPFHGFSPADFSQMSEKYGDIFTIYIGGERCVVMNSYELMKEALVDKYQDFSDRGTGYIVQNTNPKQHGIVQADYDDNMRRYRNESLSILRTLGFGKPVMEAKIKTEVEDLCSVFASRNAQPFNPGPVITIYVTNVIYSILFNERFEHDDKKILDTVKTCDDLMATGMKIFILDYFPFLRPLPAMKKTLQRYMQCYKDILDFLNVDIQKHFENHVTGMDSDFLHALIDKHLDPETSKADIDLDNLRFLLRDFFIAGMETTTTSIQWTLVFMLNNPDIQDKAHSELDTVVGRDRLVSLADKQKLPYIEAIIWEVQRFRTIVPLSVTKYVHRDTTLGGYDIPGRTRLLQNTQHVHMKAATWGDPERFRPERFLDDNGAFLRHSHLIPFSIGKRQCLGEVLARQELFLFTANLLQKFRFTPSDGIKSVDEEGRLGFTFSPKPFEIKAIPR